MRINEVLDLLVRSKWLKVRGASLMQGENREEGQRIGYKSLPKISSVQFFLKKKTARSS